MPGLTYYLPAKAAKVSVTVSTVDEKKDKNGKVIQAEGTRISNIEISTTEAYPDLDQRYVLNYENNPFAKNTFNFGVSRSGLLTSGNTKSDVQLSETLNALAGSLGAAGTIKGTKSWNQRRNYCDSPRIYTYIIADTASSPDSKICGYFDYSLMPLNDFITRLNGNDGNLFGENPSELNAAGFKGADQSVSAKSRNGVYYRQEQPYIFTLYEGDKRVESVILSLPSNEVHFLPLAKTTFSDNEASFAFEDGILTGFNQTTEGEALAIVKLPAEILDSYFSAIGSVLDGLKENADKEKSLVEATEQLDNNLARQNAQLALLNKTRELEKSEACLEAFRAEDKDRLEALGCN
ncbi:hypothetical protein [Microbulbifer magnicolonia]|uniref:hypothetical protein n=1 Tax=Microbulbifer magnicolonia TaxID=3109744 RepID=UPI002B41712B|nr:hypothetical protein [Microbulbifer sp. GG15]